MLLRPTLPLFLLLGFLGGLGAQTNYTTVETTSPKARKYYETGMRLRFNRHFAQALQQFEKALKADGKFVDARINRAGVLAVLGELEAAEAGFEAVLAMAPNHDPEVFFDVGLVEWRLGKFDEAARHFQQYLDSPADSERRRASARKFLADARFRAEALRHPVPFEPHNLGPAINTPRDEYLPSLTADGKTLIYTTVVNGQEDFYVSHWKDGRWERGRPLEGINTPMNEGAQTISADGRLLIFTGCNRPTPLGRSRCDLFYSEFRKGKWTPVAFLEGKVNTRAWESQPSLSADGRTLYFASDRPGGLGGSDLWVSHRLPDGSWGEPQNLGDSINTAQGDEQAPFIHPDGQTLFFISDGHPGMGKDDIYFARRRPDGSWGRAQNLGYPINTEFNEGPLFISLDGRIAFFGSDRTDFPGAQGRMDIYYFELPEKARPRPVTYVKARVHDAISGEPLIAEVEFVELANQQTHARAQTDEEGIFLVTLPTGANYALNVSREGYFFYSENFALEGYQGREQPFELDIPLQPLPGTSGDAETPPPPIVLRNIFFESGSATLLEASLVELRRLLKLLQDNPKLRIQINGHTDNVGTDADNLTLSENRARAVYDWLVEHGIAPERLRYKGFGETTPIADNDTEEGRSRNRRTEFQILN